MTKERAAELSEILKAYSEGKTIQICCGNQSWRDISEVEMERFAGYSQPRIKPESKLVSFTFEDNLMFRDKWVKYKGCFPLSRVTCFGPKGLCYSEGSEWESYKDCLEKYEFEDGTPFGKYINEHNYEKL